MHRWIKRNVFGDGEVIYDTVSRNIYRDGVKPVIDKDTKIYSLPTFDSRAPLKVYFDFTYLCNLECRHCITNSSPRVNIDNELSSKHIKSIIDELAAIGIFEIGIGGGEPLCRADIYQILAHARTKGLNTVLTTNGILVTSKVAQRLNEARVSEVRVSFDGSEAVHDSIRGFGTYRKTLEALRVLVENGLKTEPRITICKDDKASLHNLFQDLVDIGVTTGKISLVFPRGRAALKENRDLFKYRRNKETAQLFMDLAREHGLDIKVPGDLALEARVIDGGELRRGKRSSCGAGFQTAYISPYGTVLPCSGMTDYIFGNVKSDSFMSSWTSQKAKNWRRFTSTHKSWFLCGYIDSISEK